MARNEKPDRAAAEDAELARRLRSLDRQLDEREAAVLVLFRDGNDEAQVALHQFLECVLVAVADLASELNLLVALEERIRAHLVQILVENVTFRLVRSDAGRRGAPTPALNVCHVLNRLGDYELR